MYCRGDSLWRSAAAAAAAAVVVAAAAAKAVAVAAEQDEDENQDPAAVVVIHDATSHEDLGQPFSAASVHSMRRVLKGAYRLADVTMAFALR